ncbi:MAG: M50 family metallopeptidase [Candidatus Hermodarchaeota archaeon]
MGLVGGLILLLSILVHELSHSLVAQKYGLKVSEIELYLFGGVSKIEEEPKTPKSEIIISIVGPLSSLLMGAGFLFFVYLPINLHPILAVTLFYSGISNIGLSIFNLIPAFPIDGGRVLRAILWKRRKNLLSATKSASKVGVIVGYSMMAYGFLQILTSGILNGFWLILIGNFLTSSARNAYNQMRNEIILSNINVKDMLSTPNLAIPFNIPVDIALRDYFYPYKKSYFPVNQGFDIVGMVHIRDIKKIPINKRVEISVGNIMKKISEFPSIDDKKSGKIAFQRLSMITEDPVLLVVKDSESERFIGFIGKSELISSLEFWSSHMFNSDLEIKKYK